MKKLCPICETFVGTSKHHIVPKSKKGKDIVLICDSCHKQIHSIFTNDELAKQFFTIEKLKQNENVQKWIKWRKTHPSVLVNHKKSKKFS